MRTLTMKLQAPLMSWGTIDGYQRRDTDTHPTKSGVLGLVGAMLGRERGEDMSDLNTLRYGCRTIKPGTFLDDLQTMGVRADGKPNPLQTKQYLMDAAFLVGLEAPDDNPILDRILDAVGHPVYTPYLGRRACPPAGPIEARIADSPLEQALQGAGVIHVETSTGTLRTDQPLNGRRFGIRYETRIDPATCDDFFNAVEDNQ